MSNPLLDVGEKERRGEEERRRRACLSVAAEGDLLLRSQIDVFAYGNSRVDGKGIFSGPIPAYSTCLQEARCAFQAIKMQMTYFSRERKASF